jgi:hypothetical protein
LGDILGVAHRDVDDAVVGKGRERIHGSRLLSTTRARGGDEHAGVLAREAAGRPELAGRVPEGLELRREVAVPGRDTEEEAENGMRIQ